jgi:putative DNA primase/helicase
MALRPLNPPVEEALGHGWWLLATEAGRSNQGLLATVSLCNPRPQAMQTLALGDPSAQQALTATYAGLAGVEPPEVMQALMRLSAPVEKALRKREAARATPKKGDDLPGSPLTFEELPSWETPVDGAQLLSTLAETFATYVVLPPGGKDLLALWTLHTYALDATQISPILGLTSPQKRCGKTTLLSLLRALVWKPLPASNITPAAVYRTIEVCAPTLLVDEADTFMSKNEELRGVLNCGHTRAMAYVLRTVGDEHEPRQFSTWCPKAIALIGTLPATLRDRTIELPLKRRTKSEPIQKWRDDRAATRTEPRRQCLRWVQDHLAALSAGDPALPESLHDRATDNWRPLVAIADTAGGAWSARARQALAALEDVSLLEEDNASVMLLTDLHGVFSTQQVDRVSSRDLAHELGCLDERPWPEWAKGKPITVLGIAKLLRPFGIKPKTIRFDADTFKGYLRADCEETFARYLPLRSVTSPQTSNDADFHENLPVTTGERVTDEKSHNAAPNMGCVGVTDENGGIGGKYSVAESPDARDAGDIKRVSSAQVRDYFEQC